MKPFKQIFYITAIVALGSHVTAVPVQPTSTAEAEKAPKDKVEQTVNVKAPVTSKPVTNSDKDLESSNSNQEATYVLPEHHSTGSTGSGAFDPSIYAGYLTPEAFQQYLAQFTGTFGPYGYPGYGPAPVYPAPYAVQSGYEGFLVPSATSLAASGTVASNSGNILTALTNLIPTFMDSTIVRVIITVIGAVLMLLFGGAVTTAICNLTPLCNISFKAVTYLRGNGAANMGRMLAEEMTPERVRRASEFVRSAIRKYNEMQNPVADNKNMI